MIDELDRARRTLISKSTVLPRSVLAAVGLGAAFGLGILAGGIGEARGNAPRDEDVLAAARARSEALAIRQSEIKLAFPAELLAPEAKGGARAVVPPTDKPQNDKPQNDKPQADKPQPDKPQPDKPQADKPQVESPGAAERDLDEEAAPADEAPRPTLQATLAKVLGGAPPTAATPPSPRAKSFALQVASLPQRAPADELAKKLAGQGLNARVVVGEVGGREVYRVRVGSFGERDKAEAAKGKLTMPSFIVSE